MGAGLTHYTQSQIPPPAHKPGVMALACHPGMGQGILGQSVLHGELESSLGYVRPCSQTSRPAVGPCPPQYWRLAELSAVLRPLHRAAPHSARSASEPAELVALAPLSAFPDFPGTKGSPITFTSGSSLAV